MNEVHGNLTIISYPRKGGGGLGKLVMAKCVCGSVKEYRLRFLKDGHTKSCGCIIKTHGYLHHPLYKIWLCMKERCYNENHVAYKDYGGRGILICDEWKYNAKRFIEWCLANGWAPGLLIDRENNNLGYCPQNVRFVTATVNQRNRRTTIILSMDGESKPLTEWAEIYSISPGVIRSRLNNGWTEKRSITEPVNKK